MQEKHKIQDLFLTTLLFAALHEQLSSGRHDSVSGIEKLLKTIQYSIQVLPL